MSESRINSSIEKKHLFPVRDQFGSQKQSVQFKDNRPENITQLNTQHMANSTIQRRENKTGMPDNLKSGIENLSGLDMSDVKVHYNSTQPAQMQAYAFAQGNQIHIASGQEKNLPHEAWHVVQQKQGRVTPTKQLKGKININDDVGLEKEADVMGDRALQMEFSRNNFSVQQKKNVRISYTDTPNKRFPIQRRTLVNYQTQPYHYRQGGVNQVISFGHQMNALIDAGDPTQGTAPGGGAQAHARNDAQVTNGGDLVLGHLLNANLGGPGLANNLYPISDVANREQLATTEFFVKNRVMANVARPLAMGKLEHVEYDVTVQPTGGVAGSGNPALAAAPTNPNSTIFSKFRERNAGVSGWAWSPWTQKTIVSNTTHAMDAVIGGWGSAGVGSRLGGAANNLRILPLPIVGAVPLTRAGGPLPPAPVWATQVLIEGQVPGGPVGTFVGYIQ